MIEKYKITICLLIFNKFISFVPQDSEQCLYMLEHVELEIPSSEPCDDASSVGSETDTASVTLLSDPTTRDRYVTQSHT